MARLIRGLLLKRTLNLLNWLMKHEGNSLIIGGPMGWSWQATLDTTHHGALAGPANAHRHSDLSGIEVNDHHDRDHATRHASGGADAITLDASQIGTGRFGMVRMPSGTSGYVLTAQGIGSDPVYAELASGGGDSCLVIAAADTPSALKNRADYVCDGTNSTGGDQNEINTALNTADSVILCPGTFWISGSIYLESNQSLVGSGPGTVITFKDGGTTYFYGIVRSGAPAVNIYVANLVIDGNKDNQTGGYHYGFRLTSDVGSNGEAGFVIDNCWIRNMYSTGIYGIGGDHCIVRNCLISACRLYGISLSGSDYWMIDNCRVYDNEGSGIASWGDYTLMRNNVLTGNGQNGAYILGDVATILGNSFIQNGYQGINASGGSHHMIAGNHLIANSQDTDSTYDQIKLASTSYSLLVGNKFHKGGETNKPRYGINISDDSCNLNCLIGNDLYDSAATGALNDVPTTNPTRKKSNRNLAGTGWLAEV